MDVDGAVLYVNFVAPNSIQQLSAAKGPIGMGHEGLK